MPNKSSAKIKTTDKGKSLKKSGPKSKKSKTPNVSVITISDDENEAGIQSESFCDMNVSKPIVYLDRADMPSPDFGKVRMLAMTRKLV